MIFKNIQKVFKGKEFKIFMFAKYILQSTDVEPASLKGIISHLRMVYQGKRAMRHAYYYKTLYKEIIKKMQNQGIGKSQRKDYILSLDSTLGINR